MTLDEALELAAIYGNGAAPTPIGDALATLAEYVREHRPVMPLAQRGRTVDHAVEVLRTDDGGAVLASLCGGLSPEVVEADDLDLSDLDTFDPTHDDACKSCTRRLPKEIRPPVPARPHRTRHPDALDRFEVWPTVVDGEYATELVDVAETPSTLVDTFGSATELGEIVRVARRWIAKVSA